MNLIQNNSRRSLVLRVLRGMALDAVLGAFCGAMYGVVFGGFVGTGDNRTSTIVWFALCVGSIVAVVAVVAGLVQARADAAEPEATPTDGISKGGPMRVEGSNRLFAVTRPTAMAIRLPAKRAPSETMSASA